MVAPLSAAVVAQLDKLAGGFPNSQYFKLGTTLNAIITSGVPPSGAAGGDLAGIFPNPTIGLLKVTTGALAALSVTTAKIALLAVTDAQVAAANKDGVAGTASMRTLGTGAAQACAGNDSRLSDSRAPTGSAGGDLTGSTYPSPTIAALAVTTGKIALLAVTDAQVAAANKDGVAGTASMRTLGTGAAQATAGNDSRLSDSRAPTGSAGGDLTGSTYPNPTIAALAVTAAKIATGTITDTQVAAANKDGASGTASMRTLSNTATTACAGNDARLSDSRAPNGSAGGSIGGTYPSSITVTKLNETGGPTALTIGAIPANRITTRDNAGNFIGGYLFNEPAYGTDFRDDFLGTVAGVWTSGTAGSGATGGQEATTPDANHPGVWFLGTGTTSTGRSGLQSQSEGVMLGGGVTIIETAIYVPILSTVAEEFVIRAGLNDTAGGTNADAADGVYFVYDRLNSGVNWQGRTASSSSRTTADLGAGGLVVAATWIRLTAIVNTGGTNVDFYVNGVLANSITTNIPISARRTGPLFRIDKTATAGVTSTFNFDYFWLNKIFTTAR